MQLFKWLKLERKHKQPGNKDVVFVSLPSLLTIDQVSELLKVHPNTLRNWDRTGKLPAVRIGVRKDRRYEKVAVIKFYNELTHLDNKHSQDRKPKIDKNYNPDLPRPEVSKYVIQPGWSLAKIKLLLISKKFSVFVYSVGVVAFAFLTIQVTFFTYVFMVQAEESNLKTYNVIVEPSMVSGWTSPENAKQVDLLSNSPLNNFNDKNSATINNKPIKVLGEEDEKVPTAGEEGNTNIEVIAPTGEDILPAVEVLEKKEESPSIVAEPDSALKAWGYTLPESVPENSLVSKVNLFVSLGVDSFPENEDVVIISYSLDDGVTWTIARSISLFEEISNATNAGYYQYAIDNIKEIKDFAKFQVKIDYNAVPGDGEAIAYLDGLSLDVELQEAEKIIDEIEQSITIADTNLEVGENPIINIDIEEDSAFPFFGVGSTQREVTDIEMIGPDGGVVEATYAVEEVEEGNKKTDKYTFDNEEFTKPGKYQVKIIIEQDGVIKEVWQDFTWGVLAINPDYPTQTTGQDTMFSIGVLDDLGQMVCDAEVELAIIGPNGQTTIQKTSDGSIKISEFCLQKGEYQGPDYYSNYKTNQPGIYQLKLTATHSNGTREISDSMEVLDSPDYTIRRDGPTRVFPVIYQPMILEVKVKNDFKGIIREFVPEEYTVKPENGGLEQPFDLGGSIARTIVWEVDLKAGSTVTLKYLFKAPEKSPSLFFLGPAKVGEWQEFRTWQQAIDPAYMFLLATSASAPAGTWTNQTTYDGASARFLRASSTYGGTGGDTTHTPTVTGATVGSASAGVTASCVRLCTARASYGHTHTTTAPTAGSANNDPAYHSFYLWKSDAQNPTTIPQNTFMFSSASQSGSWTRFSAADSRLVKLTNSHTTGGSNTHTHSMTSWGSLAAAVGTLNISGFFIDNMEPDYSTASHTHTAPANSNSTSSTSVPEYVQTMIYQQTNATPQSIPQNMIGMFDADPGTGWDVISDASPYLNRFIQGFSTESGTGGNATHDDTATATTSIPRGALSDLVEGANVATDTHTHTVTATITAGSVHTPPNVDWILAKCTNASGCSGGGTVNMTGKAYTDKTEGTPITTGTSVCVAVNAGTPSCDATDASGVFDITGVTTVSGDQLTFFIDGGSILGNTVTVSDGAAIVAGDNLRIYQNTVMVRQETGTSIEIVEMDAYDNDQNATDMLYDAEDLATDTLVVESNIELLVYVGFTLDPNGTVTTQGTGSLYIDDNATAYLDTATSTIASQFTVDTGATLSVSSATTNINGTGTNTVTGTLSGTGSLTLLGTLTGAGTVSMTSGSTITQSVNGAGRTIGSNSGSNNWTFVNLTLTNTSGTNTITSTSGGSGQIIVNGTLTTSNSGTALIFDNETNDRILDINYLAILSGSTISASSTASFTISGNIGSAGTFTANSGTVTFDGTSGTKYINMSSAYFNVTFNGSGSTWQNDTTAMTVTNNIIITAGTFAPYYSVTVNGGVNGGVTLNGGTLNISANTFAVGNSTDEDLTISSGAVVVSGGILNVTEILDVNGGTFNTSGSPDVNITGILDQDGGIVTIAGGTFDTLGDANDVATGGTFTQSGGTVTFGNSTTEDLTIAGGTVSLGGTLTTINDDLIMTSGTLTVTSDVDVVGIFNQDAGTSNINAGANVDVGGITTSGVLVDVDGGTVNLNNGSIDSNAEMGFAGNTTVNLNGGSHHAGTSGVNGTITWNNTAGNFTLNMIAGTNPDANGCNITSSNFNMYGTGNLVTTTVTGGTICMGTAHTARNFYDAETNVHSFYNLKILENAQTNPSTDQPVRLNGSFIINTSKTFDALDNTIEIMGDYTNSGTFTGSTSTMTFNSTVLGQILSGNMTGTSSFYNLTLANTGGGIIFSSGATATNNFTAITASQAIVFGSGATYTFQNINVNGQAIGTRVSLTGIGTWNLNVAGTRTVLNASVSYSNACGQAPNIDATDASNQDATNNSCWDFPSVGLTVSGNIYTDDGSTAYNCSTDNLTVSIKVNGAGTYTGTCTLSSGAYSISSITAASGAIITAFLDGETPDAATVTRSNNANISGLNIYQNRLIVRHEDGNVITNANLGQYDYDNDTDIPFTSNSNNLVVNNNTKFYIWGSKSYSAGGTVTTSPSSDYTSPDGDIYIAASAYFIIGSNTLSIGGDFINAGEIVVSGAPTTTFTATSVMHVITSNNGSFYNVIFDGVNGSWYPTNTFSVSTSITMTNGTFTSGQSVNVAGNFTGNASVNFTGGTLNMSNTTASIGGTTAWTISSLYYQPTGTGTLTTAGLVNITGDISIGASDTLSIASGHTATWRGVNMTLTGTISGLGRLTVAGIGSIIPSGGTISSIVRFDITDPSKYPLIPGRTFGGLVEVYTNEAQVSNRTVYFSTAGSQTFTFNGDLVVIADNLASVNVDFGQNSPTVNLNGNIDFTGVGAGTEIINFGGGTWNVAGSSIDCTGGSCTGSNHTFNFNAAATTVNGGTAGFGIMTVSGSTTLTLTSGTILATSLALTSSGVLQANTNFTVSGNITGNGTLTYTSGTPTFTQSSTGNFGGDTAWKFYNLFLDTAGSNVTTTTTGSAGAGITVDGTLTIDFWGDCEPSCSSRTLNAGAKTWTLANLAATATPLVNSGNLVGQTSTFVYAGSTAVNVVNANNATTDYFYNLNLQPTGTATFTLPTASVGFPMRVNNNLLVGNGTNSVTVTGGTNNTNLTVGSNFECTTGASTNTITTGTGIWTIGGYIDLTNCDTFTATTGHTFTMTGATGQVVGGGKALYNLTTSTSSSAQIYLLTDNLTLNGDMTVGTNTTLFVNVNLTVNGGDITGDGGLTYGAISTITIPTVSGSIGGNTNWSIYNLHLHSSINCGDADTSAIGSGSITIGNILTTDAMLDPSFICALQDPGGYGHRLVAGSKTWYFTRTGTPISNQGAIDFGTSTAVYNGAGGVNVLSAYYYNLQLSPAASQTYALLGHIGVTGNSLIISNLAALTGNFQVTTYGASTTVNAGGITFYRFGSYGTTTTVASSGFSVSNLLTVYSSSTLSIDLSRTVTVTAGGTVTLTGVITGDGRLTYQGVTNFPNTGTISSIMRYDGTPSGDQRYVTVRSYGGDLEIYSNATDTTRTFWLGETTGTIAVTGNFSIISDNIRATSVNGGSSNPALTVEGNFSLVENSSGSAEIVTGTGTFTVGGNVNFGTGLFFATNLLKMTGTSKLLISDGNSVNNFEVASGSITMVGTTALSGNLTISGGTLTAPSAGTLSVAGSFLNTGGTFTHNNSTVSLTTAAAVTVSGNNTFYNFTIQPGAAKTVTFANGSTTTVSQTLIFDGALGQLVTLQSQTGGTSWNLRMNGISQTINYVSVRDSNACGGTYHIQAYDGTNTNVSNNQCWDFTSLIISGTASSSLCDQTIAIAVGAYRLAQTGQVICEEPYNFSVTIGAQSANAIISVWADGVAEGIESTAITKYNGTGNISGMWLLSNVLSIGNTGGTPTLSHNEVQGLYAYGSDEDIMHGFLNEDINPIGAGWSSDPWPIDDGNTYANEQLRILSGTTFTMTSVWGEEDGSYDVTVTHNLLNEGTITITNDGRGPEFDIGGSWANTGTFNRDISIVNFLSSAAETIAPGGQSFYRVIFSNGTGSWNNTAAMAVTNDLTHAAGLVWGTQNVTVNGNVLCSATCGNFNFTAGTFTQSVATAKSFGTVGVASAWSFNNLTFTDNGNAITSQGTGTITVAGTLTSTNLTNAGAKTWILTNTGTPFIGGMTPATSTFRYTGAGATNITDGNYNNLDVLPGANSATHTLGNGIGALINVAGNFIVGDGTHTSAVVTGVTNIETMDINGNVTIAANTTFVAPSGLSNWIYVGGNWTNSGTFTHSSSEVIFDSTTPGHTINSGGSGFYSIAFNGVDGAWSPLTNTLTASNITMAAGTFDTSSGTADVYVTGLGAGSVDCGGSCGIINMTSTNTFTVAANTFGPNVGTTSWTFFNLNFEANSSPDTITLLGGGSGDINVLNNFTIQNPGTTLTIDNNTNDRVFDIDGNFTIAANCIYQASSSAVFEVGGNWSNVGTFTGNNGTVTFNAGDSGNTIDNGASNFANVVFNNAAGNWSNSSTMGLTEDMTITAGTFNANNNVTVSGGDITGNGTLSYTSGTPTFNIGDTDLTGSFGGNTGWSFYNLTFQHTLGSGAGAVTTATGSGSMTINNVMTIQGQAITCQDDDCRHALQAGSKTWTLTASGTPFVSANGRFTPQTSTVQYTGTNATNITGTVNPGVVAYYHLYLQPSGGSNPSYTLPTTFSVGGNLLVGNGVNAVTVVGTTNNPTFTTTGNLSCTAGATNTINSGTGTWAVGGNVDLTNCTYTATSGNTVRMYGTSKQLTTAGRSLHHLWVSTGSTTMIGATTLNGTLTMSGGTLTGPSSGTLSVAGSIVDSGGVYVHNNSTVSLTTSAAASVSGDNTFYNLSVSGIGAAKTLTFADGSTTTVSNNLIFNGASGQVVTLQSQTPDTAWNLNMNGTLQTIHFVSVRDSNACGGTYHIRAYDGTNTNVSNNPCWDFTSITVSGSSNAANSTVVAAAINSNRQAQTGTVNSGTWTVTVGQPTNGDTITVWLDNVAEGTESTALTKWSTGNGNLSSLVLTSNILSIGANNTPSLTGIDFNKYDALNDEDIMHDSVSAAGYTINLDGGGPYTSEKLSIRANATLTLSQVGGETPISDFLTTHDFEIQNGGTFINSGSPNLYVNGSWSVGATATYTVGTEDISFTSTTTETIDSGGDALYHVSFNGSGGQWTLSSALTANGDVNVNAGTLTGSQNLTVNGGDFNGDGTVTFSAGTVTLPVAGTFGGSSTADWTLNNIALTQDACSSYITTTVAGSGKMNISGTITSASCSCGVECTAEHSLNPGAKTWDLTYTGEPLATAQLYTIGSTATWQYIGSGNMTVTGHNYYNLVLQPASGTPVYTLANSSIYVSQNLTISSILSLTEGSSTMIVGGFGLTSTVNAGDQTLYNFQTYSSSGTDMVNLISNMTLTNILGIGSSDILTISSNKKITVLNTADSNSAITGFGTIAGGTVEYQDADPLISTPIINSPFIYNSVTTNQTIGDRTYGGNVTFENTSSSARTATMEAGTHTFGADLTVQSTGTGGVTLIGAQNNPTIGITGNLAFGASNGKVITSGTNTWTVGGNVNFTNGTYTATSGNTLKMTGAAGGLTSATQSLSNFEAASPAGTITMNDALTTAGDIAVSSGTLAGAYDMTVNGGDLTGDGILNLSGGTASLVNNGTVGTATGSNNWTFNNLSLTQSGCVASTTTSTNAGTGTIEVKGTLNGSGCSCGGECFAFHRLAAATGGPRTWVLSGSGNPIGASFSLTNADTEESTFRFTGTGTTDVVGGSFHNIEFVPTGSPSYTVGSLTLYGNLTIDSDIGFDFGSNTLRMRGDGTTIDAGAKSFYDFILDGTNTTVTAQNTGLTVTRVVQVNLGNTLSIDSGQTFRHTGIIYILNGTVSGAGTMLFTNTSSGPGTGGALSAVVRYDSSAGNIASTTFDARTYGGDVVLYGNNSSNSITTATGTYTFSGGLTSTQDGTGATTTEFNTNDPTTTITGALSIGSNTTFSASSSGTFNVNGNYTNNGTFTDNGGTVTLAGVATQTLSGTMTGSSDFNNLIITNAFGSVTGCDTSFTPGVSFAASTTISGTYTITTPGVKVRYNSGSTYTVTNINWVGANGNNVIFRNSNLTSGTWLLNVSGIQTDVSYVSVARSDASSGSAIMADNGTNTNCNNNTNWRFGISISGTIYSDNGSTPYDCSQNNLTLKSTVNGGQALNFTNACTAANGNFTIHANNPSATGDPLIVYVDSGESQPASTVTTSADTQSSITGLNLFIGSLVVQNEDSGAINMSDLNNAWINDAGVLFGDVICGDYCTNLLTSGIDVFIKSNEVFNIDSNINTVAGDVLVAGTLQGDHALRIGGGDLQGVNNSGTVNMTGDRVYLYGDGALGGSSSDWSFNDLKFSQPSSCATSCSGLCNYTTTVSGTGKMNINGQMSSDWCNYGIGGESSAIHIINLGDKIWEINSSGTGTQAPLYQLAKNVDTSTVRFNSVSGAATDASGAYYNLEVLPGVTSNDFEASLGLSIFGNLYFNPNVDWQTGTYPLSLHGDDKTIDVNDAELYQLYMNDSNFISVVNSDLTVKSTVQIGIGSQLEITDGRIFTHDGGNLQNIGTISQTGSGLLRLTHNSSGPGATGIITADVRYDASGGNVTSSTFDARTYGGDVEIYSNSANARSVAMASGTQQINGSLKVNTGATQSQVLTLDASANSTVNIVGDLNFTKSGSATPAITSGTGVWTVGGDVNFTNGTYTATSGNTFKMNGSGKNITSAGQTLHNFEVSGGGIRNADTMDVNGTFDVTAGGFTQGATANVNVAGDFTLANSTTFTKSSGTGLLIFDGDLSFADNTSPLQDLGSVDIGASPDTTNLTTDFSATNLKIKTADVFNTHGYEVDLSSKMDCEGSCTFDLTDDGETDGTIVTVGGNWTMSSSATFTPSTDSLVTFDGSGNQTVTTGGKSFNDFKINNSGTTNDNIVLSGNLDVNGNLTVDNGEMEMSSNNPNVNTSGDVTFTSGVTVTKGTGTWTFDGTTAKIYTDNTATAQNIGAVVFNKTSGTPAQDKITLASAMTADTIDIQTGDTLDLASGPYTLTLAKVGATATVLTVTGTLTPGNSIVKYSATNSGGNVNIATTTYDSLQLSGAETYGLSGNLTSTNGLNDDITIDSGATLDVTGSNYNIDLAGDWTNNGEFTDGTGTVTLDGTSTQTLSGQMTGATDRFYNLTVTNAGASNPDIDFASAAEVANNFTASTASSQLEFNAGSTYTFNNVSFNGSTGSLVILRSSSPGTQWNLTSAGAQTVTYTDVQDSNACGGDTIDATGGTNVNSQNNDCWVFVGMTVSLSPNSIDLGTLSNSLVSQDGVTLTVSTDAANGYQGSVYYDNTLNNGLGDSIADTTGGTIVAGTEEFGASSSRAGYAIGQWSPAACSDTASTSNATALTTSPQTFTGASSGVSGHTTNLCVLGSITGITNPGSYGSTLTIVVTGLF